MKRNFIITTLSVLFVSCMFVSNIVPIADAAAAVKTVNFYPFGARFTYEVESGGEFEFSIPGAFDEDSVRCLSLEHLSSIKVERVAVPDVVPEELKPYEARVDEARKALSLLEGRGSAARGAIQFLAAPFQQVPYEGEPGFDGDGLIRYAQNAYKSRIEFEAELVDINMSITKATHDYEEAKREYEDARARFNRMKGAVPETVIDIRGTTDVPGMLTFEAFTSYAGWNVVYEMNLDSARSLIDAKMNATAWQHTGVNIEGDVAFNTRQPSYSVAPPQVSPLTVGLRQRSNNNELARGGMAPQAEYFTEDAFMMDMAMPAPAAPRQAPPVISTLANVSVMGSGKIDGDGSQVRVKLGDFEIECVPQIISVPEQSREAWIVASIDVVPDAFLPGVAELSVDNAATGRTHIAESVVSARVPFGMASRVTAKKEPYVTETGSSWLGTGTRNDGYTLEITNGMDTEREITVMDRIPFPIVDKVTLDVGKIDPAPEERDKENRLTWNIKLAPGEIRKITVEYTIKYPGDETLEFRH